MSTTSQSNLTLSYFYWSSHPHTDIGVIDVPPETNVFVCKQTILQTEQSSTRASITDLYTIPQNHPVLLKDLNATLGSLSISDLGEPLPARQSLASIFAPQTGADRLDLILVNQGMYFF
ncbi:hypothetical protein OG21DRAFT_252360 [Imleria badia]|nr:hypothetical protein OG21DRAFT_252360 [Imleria badia]